MQLLKKVSDKIFLASLKDKPQNKQDSSTSMMV